MKVSIYPMNTLYIREHLDQTVKTTLKLIYTNYSLLEQTKNET